MDLFFETQSGSTFSIEVGYWDTVLEIKKKIEKYQGFPVSEQTLFFEGKCLEDDLDIEQCKIFHKSRLQVYVGKDQVLQTERYPPLKSAEQIINTQDLPVTVQVQSLLSNSVKEINKVQDSPVKGRINKKVSKRIKFGRKNSNNHQVLQTEQSLLLKSAEQIINNQDLPVTVQVQSPLSNSVKEIINVQDSPVKVRSNNKNTHQVLQTKKGPSSNSNKEINKIPDLPYWMRVEIMRFTVFVLPYSGESNAARKIRVDVKPWAKVKTLRNDLVQFQLNLPQEGYCFIHKQKKMVEDKSFISNRVDDGDTIEISPIHVTCGS